MSSKIIYDIKLFGAACFKASKLNSGYQLAMFTAIKDEYENKPYNLNRFMEYHNHTSDEKIEDVRSCYPELAKCMDSQMHGGEENVFFVEHIYQDDFYGQSDTNVCVGENIWFTCQFMARVININVGDRYVMEISKLNEQMHLLIVQARREMIHGFILLPEGTPENGYVYAAKRTLSYTVAEAEEIAKLKPRDKVLVEFIKNPCVIPKGVICTCKYISTVR